MESLIHSLSVALQLLWDRDPALVAIVGRSLAVSATATAIASVAGLLLGAWLAVVRFGGRSVLLALLNTMLAVPSVVVGLVV
jgi:tungstate transport system permease protein